MEKEMEDSNSQPDPFDKPGGYQREVARTQRRKEEFSHDSPGHETVSRSQRGNFARHFRRSGLWGNAER
jgi:hypothetical protein